MLHFSKSDEETNSSYSWMIWEWADLFIFEWIILASKRSGCLEGNSVFKRGQIIKFYILLWHFWLVKVPFWGKNRRLFSGRIWSASKVQDFERESKQFGEKDFVRTDDRDVWSSSLSPAGWLSIVQRRKRTAWAPGCGKERCWATDRADQADLDAHTHRDSAENSTATDGGFSKRELQNTRVWEELQAVIKSFARDATPSLMLTLNLCKSQQTHTQHLKTNCTMCDAVSHDAVHLTWTSSSSQNQKTYQWWF